MADIRSLPRVATIATMASRIETFPKVLEAIRSQVDHTFVYLDGYTKAPAFLEGLDKITVHHAEAVGNLHASSRFLCLRQLARPAVVVIIDDDIVYPPNYVTVMAEMLQQYEGQAVVGVHGRLFVPPHQSYVRDASQLHFALATAGPHFVHELGTGTCAFVSDRFRVDPKQWGRHDMDDLMVAIEAQRRGMPRIAIPRAHGWLKPIAQDQEDSLWVRTQQDDSEQSRRMRVLLGLYAREDPSAIRTRQSREVPQSIPMREHS